MQGPKWPLFYSHIDPVWSLLIIGTGCTLGRAPRTKETLPDFRELCRVTRHPRVFSGLTGCQQDPRDRGVTRSVWFRFLFYTNLDFNLGFGLQNTITKVHVNQSKNKNTNIIQS